MLVYQRVSCTRCYRSTIGIHRSTLAMAKWGWFTMVHLSVISLSSRHCSLQKTLGRIDAQSIETFGNSCASFFEYLWILKLKGSARITRIVYHHFWSFQRFIPENISINHELSTTSSPRPLRTASPHCRSSWLVEWWLIGLTTSHNHFKVKQGTGWHWSFLGGLKVWKLSSTNRFGAPYFKWCARLG